MLFWQLIIKWNKNIVFSTKEAHPKIYIIEFNYSHTHNKTIFPYMVSEMGRFNCNHTNL